MRMETVAAQSGRIAAIVWAKFTRHMTLALLIILMVPAQPVQAMLFRNFSTLSTLIPLPDGFFSLAGVKVKTTNRIIVKAAPGVGKEALHKVDTRIAEITELYLLDSGSYFSVSFPDPQDLEQILARFIASPLILIAQPDLLQIHDKSGRNVTHRNHVDYIRELGIDALWQNTKGKGIQLAIIDDGFDLKQEDLQGVTLTFGYDLESGTLNPFPRAALDTHGTKVAGIIFARHNGIGIDGIAPDAGFIAIRHSDTWTSKTILSFYLAKIAGADIINCSWKSRYLLEPIADVISDLTSTGRGGKGVVVVFAAGNEGMDIPDHGNEAALSAVITVGAVGGNGRPLKFSNFGKDVDIYTFGRDILTTSWGAEKYALFSGTSASAAIVSGTSALLLSQEPDLNLKDLHQKIVSFFQ